MKNLNSRIAPAGRLFLLIFSLGMAGGGCSSIKPQKAGPPAGQAQETRTDTQAARSAKGAKGIDPGLASKYPFASVCQALAEKQAAGGEVRINQDVADGCHEGVDALDNNVREQLLSLLDQPAGDCFLEGGFYDRRYADCINRMGEVAYRPPFEDAIQAFAGVEGIAELFAGYQALGWEIEQLAVREGKPYISLMTVVLNQNRPEVYAKAGYLRTLQEACQGQTGGLCDEVTTSTERKALEVLYISQATFVYRDE